MKHLCDELKNLLNPLPNYASWAVSDLERIFLRFREIVSELSRADGYSNYKWFENHCPDLSLKIELMIQETDSEKQAVQFNNIVSQLDEAIDVITGKIDCGSEAKLKQLVLG